MPEQKTTWKETNIAGLVFDPGCTAEYKTGTWRASRPVHHMDKCTHCLLC